MLLPKFDPPGFLDDFTSEQADAWHRFISDSIDGAITGFPAECQFDAPRAQFFNQTKTGTDADAVEADIAWTAFPRNVKLGAVSEKQRLRIGDSSRDRQDEYCEWSVERDASTDKITKITFTCEGPEYWQFLAGVNPDKVLELYRQFVDPAVERSDLFLPNGRYNARNRWNNSTASGSMHLIQRNNTLGAEIELAAGSSVVRVIGGQMLTGEKELIECGQYGDPERHSDPHIGAGVNSLTRQKADVALTNPVGIYFDKLTTTGWATPDGTESQKFWKYTRGKEGKPVRAEFTVPADAGYTVSDITINGKAIEFGGQVADFIEMKLTGTGTRFGQSTVAPMIACRLCQQADAPVADDSGQISVAAVLRSVRRRPFFAGTRH